MHRLLMNGTICFFFTQWLFVRDPYTDLYLLFIPGSSEYAQYLGVAIRTGPIPEVYLLFIRDQVSS